MATDKYNATMVKLIKECEAHMYKMIAGVVKEESERFLKRKMMILKDYGMLEDPENI